MNKHDDDKAALSRRSFLAKSCGFAVATSAAGMCPYGAAQAQDVTKKDIQEKSGAVLAHTSNVAEPFWGEHQGGILTPMQGHTYFASLDLVTTDREDIVRVLKAWTKASARLAAGMTAQPPAKDDSVPAKDSGDADGLTPSRLTLTFGFGPGLFTKDGKDRYGLAAQKPAAFVDLPKFTGDQLVETRSGGDLCIQACADDPQVAFHAVRQLVRMAYEVATLRWVQSGFTGSFDSKETSRNLMGFRDGSNNLSVHDSNLMDRFIWVGSEGPEWARSGSYMVTRRIRIALEHWDQMNLSFQEQTIGRHKASGAPLGGTGEFDKEDFDLTDKDGNLVIPENAHIRLAAAANNDGARILRRSYGYNDGSNITAERWPPWRQEMEYDAGLFFVCYQKDIRTGFTKIFENMAKFDMMNQFVTHIASAHFICPPGVKEGQYIGQGLFEKA